MNDLSDTTSLRGLLDDGTQASVSIGEQIWIQPGVKDNLYYQPSENITSFHEAYAGCDVVFPVIDCEMVDETHSFVTVDGFIKFHVICAAEGCNDVEYDWTDTDWEGIDFTGKKIIVGYFAGPPFYGGPIGGHYGPMDRCRLCQ